MKRATRKDLYLVATIMFALAVAACGGGGSNFNNIPSGGSNGAGTISGNAK